MSLSSDLVDAINDVSGVHPGHRAVHAKGVLCEGAFTAAPEAARLTRAAHMQGEPMRVTVRFSNGSGDPEAHDGKRDGRGMATKFYLPDGSRTDIVGLTLPAFFVRTPEDFLQFMRARKPDPETGQPDLEKVGAFLGAHPEAQPAIEAALSTPPPASYAQCAYNGIHSFAFESDAGERRFARYRWEPEAGEQSLEDDEALARSPNYLREELSERLERGPVAFELWLVLAEDGDAVDGPTVALPPERERVRAGRLELAGFDTSREQGGDVLVFDPTRVTDGIECSADPILQARSGAYSESVARRTASPPDRP